MAPKCTCDEPIVFKGFGPRGLPDRRFDTVKDDELTARARLAHNCDYIRRRNATIPEAHRRAEATTRVELPAEPLNSPKFLTVLTRHFHDEMSRLNKTPNYVPRAH